MCLIVSVPGIRIARLNAATPRRKAKYVLYWMVSARRTRFNFGLDRALEHAASLGLPLIVLEALRVGYPWASDRFHRFVIEGMVDNAARFAKSPAHYYPFVEAAPGKGRGLLGALAKHAAVVVSDDFPCFFLPRMQRAAAARLSVPLEVVDSNGLLPLRATDRAFSRAFDFRRALQKQLPEHLGSRPVADPLRALSLPTATLPGALTKQFPRADLERLCADGGLAALPIDHDVAPVRSRGGEQAGRRCLQSFMRNLDGYLDRSHPDSNSGSGLSPYLHFGHVSSHDIFARITRREEWSPHNLSSRTSGQREGWWNMSGPAEAFLDQVVTWRELGFNFCAHRDDYDRYSSLPEWVKENFKDHQNDVREHTYSFSELERAETHDPLWNAAQRELLSEGRIQNYLRMLWGKNILLWSRTPQAALKVMLHLNNKYAIDGRDPNSYAGIFWVLGRYDRPWAPRRPVLGTVRYMSSANTQKKLRLAAYLNRWGAQQPLFA